MKEKVKIYTSLQSYDVSSWHIEKTDNVVRELTRISELVSQNSLNDKEDIIISLYSAIHDSIKLLSFSCGVEWTPDDRDLILDKGFAGYEELKVRYGLMKKTEKQERKEEVQYFFKKMKEYLLVEMPHNRTLLYELLINFKSTEFETEDLLEKIEEVTMGELSWERFVDYAKMKIRQAEENLNV